MAIQKIPFEAVQKVRQYITTALVLPESENHPKQGGSLAGDEVPEPSSLDELGDLFKFSGSLEADNHTPNDQGLWFVSAANPGAALIKLPGLRLNPDLRLVSYLHRTAVGGVGATWAIPEALSTTAQLEKALTTSQDINQPPCPEGALANFMEAIDGDRSPTSFMIASILRREIKEFGALGKHCQWTHHRLINTIPSQVNWQWQTEMPKDFSPKVLALSDGRVAVEFFSCRIVAPIAIFRHLDQYPVAGYHAQCLDKAVAIAKR